MNVWWMCPIHHLNQKLPSSSRISTLWKNRVLWMQIGVLYIEWSIVQAQLVDFHSAHWIWHLDGVDVNGIPFRIRWNSRKLLVPLNCLLTEWSLVDHSAADYIGHNLSEGTESSAEVRRGNAKPPVEQSVFWRDFCSSSMEWTDSKHTTSKCFH